MSPNPPWWLPKMCWALPATPEGWGALHAKPRVGGGCLCEWGITEPVVNPKAGYPSLDL